MRKINLVFFTVVLAVLILMVDWREKGHYLAALAKRWRAAWPEWHPGPEEPEFSSSSRFSVPMDGARAAKLFSLPSLWLACALLALLLVAVLYSSCVLIL